MRQQCFAKNCPNWRTDFGISDVVNHFRTVHGALPVKLTLGRVAFKVKLLPNVEGVGCVKFPIIVEHDGVHFLFVATHIFNRHYFMFYFIEHEFLPKDRQLQADLYLLPAADFKPIKKSGDKTIIYPIIASFRDLFTEGSDKLYFVENEEFLENHVRFDGHYYFEFTLEELPKRKISTSSSDSDTMSFVKQSETGSSDSGIKDNTESQDDKTNLIEGKKEAGDKLPLDEKAVIENQSTSTASNSSFKALEETQLQKEKSKIQPDKLDEHGTPFDNHSQELKQVFEKQAENQKDHKQKVLIIDESIDSKGSSSESVVGKLVSLEYPNCNFEICTLTTRGKLTVAPLLNSGGQKSDVSQQKQNLN